MHNEFRKRARSIRKAQRMGALTGNIREHLMHAFMVTFERWPRRVLQQLPYTSS